MATAKTRSKIVPVDIEIELYQKIRKKADSERYSIRKYVNVVLNLMLTDEVFAHELFPRLEKIRIMDNKCFIQNVINQELFVVQIKNNKVWCQKDNSNNCEHVLFSLLCFDISGIFKTPDT